MKWKGFVLFVAFLAIAVDLPAQESRLQQRYLNIHYSRDTAYTYPLIRQSLLLQDTDIDKAIYLTRTTIGYSRLHGFTEGIATGLLYLISQMAMYKKDLKQTDLYLSQAWTAIQELPGNIKGWKMVYYYRAKAYRFVLTLQIDSSAYYYNQALGTIEKYGLQQTELTYCVYMELANIYGNNDQPERLLYYLKKAEPLITFAEDRIPLYVNFARTYATLGKYEEAEQYCEKGLEQLQSDTTSAYANLKSDFYSLLGQVRTAEHKLPEAVAYYKKALAEDKKTSLSFRAIDEYEGLAEALYQAGAYREAEHYLQKGVSLALQLKLGQNMLVPSYILLYRLYSGPIPNYRQAYYYRDMAATINDSLQNIKKQELINGLEIRYRTLEKDKSLNEQRLLLVEKDKELFEKKLSLSKQKYWITLFILAILLVISLLVLVYRNSLHRLRLQAKNINELQQEKEISNLRSVIAGEERERLRLAKDLHDGILVLLSCIKMNLSQLARRHKDGVAFADLKELNTQMEEAIRELRHTAHNLMPDTLTEGGLSEAIFYFCRSLQKSTQLNIAFQQQGRLPRLSKQSELSIYRIVQELLQNILKHAAATGILIQLNYMEGLLGITVEDNGNGFDTTSSASNEGIGLKSIRIRLQELQGNMDIRSRTPGTSVYIEVAIHNIENNQANHAY